MIQFDIITIFPEIFDSYIKESIIKRAREKKLIKINIHNLRNWAEDKHRTVDDRPFGGGLGMVLKIGPIYRAVAKLKKPGIKDKERKVILFTPRGKKFNQKAAFKLSGLKQIIMICGRYEGVDERVARHIADEIMSIGDYDLMGGELPALVVVETIARLAPGVIGKPKFLKERVADKEKFIEYPQYTRPEIFIPKKGVKWKAPKILLSGNHKKIERWRKGKQKII